MKPGLGLRFLIATIMALAVAAPAAFAHVTLEQQKAPIGETYKAVLRVPHGCDGSATTAIRVQVPEGIVAARPQPKGGWDLATEKGDYEQAHDLYGSTIKSGVREIDWTGGHLPDAYYDEFVFSGYLSNDLKPGTTLYVPVVQECERDAIHWIDRPDDGSDIDSDTPAAELELLPEDD